MDLMSIWGTPDNAEINHEQSVCSLKAIYRLLHEKKKETQSTLIHTQERFWDIGKWEESEAPAESSHRHRQNWFRSSGSNPTSRSYKYLGNLLKLYILAYTFE